MGEKGSKMRVESIEANKLLLEKLASIEGVSSKKMFGGFGLFHDNKMFGLIDSKGVSFLKADEQSKSKFLALGGTQHSRMPYYAIPTEIKNNFEELIAWTKLAIQLSK